MRKLISLPTAITRSIFTRVTASRRVSVLVCAFLVVALVATVFVWRHVYASDILWSSSTTGGAWLSTGNWTGGAVPTGTDNAQFGANPTNANSTVGINGNGTLVPGAQVEDVGAIEVTSARSSLNLAIGNSTSVAGKSINLALKGTIVNGVANTILRNNGAGTTTLTLQDNVGVATQLMGVRISNAAAVIDAVKDINISSIVSSGTSGNGFTKTGAGTLTLSAANTLNGDITVSAGTFKLTTGGTIASVPNIAIAGGATVDVSTLTSALTLGSSQTLKANGSGSTGTIATTTSKGLTLGATSGLQFTAYNGSTAPLTVTGAGSVTLASGNVVTVTVPGSALGAGDYKLIAIGSGNTTAVNGTAPSSVTVNGAGGLAGGTTASLVITSGELFLHVAVASSPTKLAITSISPASPTAGSGFNVTVQSQDGSNTPSNVAANTGFTLTTNGNAGAIGGTTTGTILAGTNQIVVSGVTLSSPGTGVTLTATRDTGDTLTPGTSAPFTVISGLASEPTVQASGVNFTSVGQNSMTVNWTSGNGTNRIVLGKQGAAVDSNPVDGTSYTANTAFGSGTQLGSGNFVVYNGTGNSVTVTNLAGGTVYQFAVYEFNGSGGTENYLTTSPATGSQATTTATYSWIGGTGDFTVAANWSPTRLNISVSDILQFNSGGVITVSNFPVQTIGQLTVSNNTVLTLTSPVAGPNTLTLSGGSGVDFSVASGSTLQFGGANPLQISLNPGTTGTVAGAITFVGTASVAHRLLAFDASAITFQSGSTFNASTNFSGNAFGSTNLNSIVFASGSTYNSFAGSNPFGAAQPSSVVVFQTGSLYSHQQTGAPSFSGRTYANFNLDFVGADISGTGTGTLSIDNLRLFNGNLHMGMTGTFNLKGNVTVDSGTTLDFNPASAATVTLNGTSSQLISGAGAITTNANQNFDISNASGISLQHDLTLNGTLTLSSGAFALSANTLGLNSTVTVSGGSLTTSNGSTVNYGQTSNGQAIVVTSYFNLVFSNFSKTFGSGNTGIAGTYTPGSATHVYTGSTISFIGSGPQTVPAQNYNNLTLAQASTKTFAAGTTGIAGVFDVTAGAVADATTNSTTIDFNGSGAQVAYPINYFNLTFSNAGTKSFAPTTTRIAGSFTITGAAVGDATSLGASIIEYNGTSAQSLPSGMPTYASLTLNNPAGTSGFAGLTVNGLLRVQAGTFTSASDYNDVTIAPAGTLSLGGNITVSGNWVNDGTFNANGFTVTFDDTGSKTIGGANQTAFAGLVIAKTSGGSITLNQSISDSTLSITNGTFDQGSGSNVTTGAASVAAGTTFRNFGTGDLTLSGNLSNAGTINFDGSGAGCGGADAIAITSSDATQRSWSGIGSFSMTDVAVSTQGGTAIITVRDGTDLGGNGPNWVFLSCAGGGGATYTWNQSSGTDYQVPLNWTPTRLLPNSSDTLIFDGSVTPSPVVTNVPTQTIASLQVTNGAFADMSTAASNALTISGGGTADFSVGSGNSLRLTGGNPLRITLASGSTGLITGFMVLEVGAHQLTANGLSTVSITGPHAIFTTATSYSSSTHPFGTGADGNSSDNSIIFASDSTYIHNNGFSPFGTTVGGVVVFQTGSEAVYLTSTGFDASGRTYSILTIGSTGALGTAVNASQTGPGDFQFDELNVESPDSGTSSLTYTGTGASKIFIEGSIFSDGLGTGGASNDTTLTAAGGIYINGGGLIELCGTSTRTTTFGSDAQVSNGTNFTLERNLIVTPTSILQINALDGSLTAGLPLPGGYVIGNLRKFVGGDTTFEVGTGTGTDTGYSPLRLSSVAGQPAYFTVRATKAPMPSLLDPTKALQRYWTLDNGGIASGKVSYDYLQGDVPNTADETKFKIFKDTNGVPPITFPEGATDNVNEATNTATTAASVSTFSNWSAGEPASVTLVKMESFGATSFNNGNLVKWQTGYEVDNVGFNVYRMSGGKLVRITPSLVAGSALIAGRTTLTAGLTYSWWDPKGLADSEYYVEDLDLNGTRTMHGPIATAYGGNIDSPTREQATLLSQIGIVQADATRFVTGFPAGGQQSGVQQTNSVSPESATPQSEPERLMQPEPAPEAPQPVIKRGLQNKLRLLEKDDVPDPMPSQRTREADGSNASTPTVTVPVQGDRLSTGNDDPIRKQRTIAAGSAVKIAVRQPGWYRVTQAELAAAGLNPNADQSRLQLFSDGIEQPILVRSSNGAQLGPDGSIEFYGIGMDTPTSDTRTYWLIAGTQPGKRINGQKGATSAAAPPEAFATTGSQGSSLKSTATASSGFSFTVERKDRIIYFTSLLNGDVDNFFGPVISKTAARQDVTLRGVDQSSSTASLQVSMQGLTVQDHKVRVVVNGYDLGLVEFAGQNHTSREFSVPASYLVEGNNTIGLTGTNGDADISLVDTVRVTYARAYRADNDALTFTSSSSTPLTVDGFTTSDIRVFDVTTSASVKQVNVKVNANGSTYSVKVPGGLGANRVLMALADSQIQHPSAITANEASSLSSSNNRADFVILTHRSFRDAVKPLADLRRSQGLETAVVDVEDVYDEFSYGAKSRTAIRDFLALAKNSWTLGPRYVLFFGDASYDPRNYVGFASQDLVPTKLIDASVLETSSDDAFADFDNDGIADMAVGRIPVQTVQQAQFMVGRITNYAPGQTNNSALLVSDHLEGYDFEAASNQLRTLLPAGFSVTMVNRGNNPTAQVKSEIISGINAGPMIVNYAGHGSPEVWTGAGILSSTDVATLSNGNRLPLFISMTCLNGRFQDSNRVSLAEALLKSENGGAIAVWASSGLTEPGAQAAIDQQLMRLLFADGQSPLLGDAVRGAKAATVDPDVRRTWILFGDPTMRMR